MGVISQDCPVHTKGDKTFTASPVIKKMKIFAERLTSFLTSNFEVRTASATPHVGLCLQIKTERRGTDVENDDDYFGRSGFFTHYSVLTTLTDSQAQVT